MEADVATQLIGARIRALREERNLSQDDLARLFGFKDRQTVSAIETGERRVTADELMLAVEKLGAPLGYFTDPFMLAGEGRFSWRQTNVGAERLNAYERNAGRWIAAFRAIAPQVGRKAPLLRRALGLTRHSRFEDAMAAGERFVAEFGLGAVPAQQLAEVMERELGILVLMVDAFEGISGAACRLPELDAVLINRQEATGRRHFDLAHELFHILTWDAMPPEHSEEARETGGNRVEQLANNFASAVLMPKASLVPYGAWADLDDQTLVAMLNAVADDLLVTASALKWRLVALDELKPARARAIPDSALRRNGRSAGEAFSFQGLISEADWDLSSMRTKGRALSDRRRAVKADPPSPVFRDASFEVMASRIEADRLPMAAQMQARLVAYRDEVTETATPALFSEPFMEVIGLAIGAGRLSIRRAAGLLDLKLEDLSDLFAAHGVEAPAEL
jgi:transcriptional regulator with XRE-family HTH domain